MAEGLVLVLSVASASWGHDAVAVGAWVVVGSVDPAPGLS